MHSHFNLNLFPNCLKIAGFEIADEVDRPKIGYFEAQVYILEHKQSKNAQDLIALFRF